MSNKKRRARALVLVRHVVTYGFFITMAFFVLKIFSSRVDVSEVQVLPDAGPCHCHLGIVAHRRVILSPGLFHSLSEECGPCL
jgi:predicted transporter